MSRLSVEQDHVARGYLHFSGNHRLKGQSLDGFGMTTVQSDTDWTFLRQVFL